MALMDYLEALPEEKREAFKKEVSENETKLSKAVFVETKEDAQKLVENNELLKAVNQSFLDKKDADRLEKFEKERMPKLLEEAKKKGEKHPWEIKIEELEKKAAEAERQTAIERQKSRALAMAAEKKIPASLINRFVGLTDEETDAALKELTETILPWRQTAIDEAIAEIGSQRTPKGGLPTKEDLQSQYEAASKAGNGPEMLRLKGLMQRATA